LEIEAPLVFVVRWGCDAGAVYIERIGAKTLRPVAGEIVFPLSMTADSPARSKSFTCTLV
jgi:hypothetical protein